MHAMTINPDQKRSILWAFELALEDQEHYLKSGNPEQDYGDEWPEVAADKAYMLRGMASICALVGEPAVAQRCNVLADDLKSGGGACCACGTQCDEDGICPECDEDDDETCERCGEGNVLEVHVAMNGRAVPWIDKAPFRGVEVWESAAKAAVDKAIGEIKAQRGNMAQALEHLTALDQWVEQRQDTTDSDLEALALTQVAEHLAAVRRTLAAIVADEDESDKG